MKPICWFEIVLLITVVTMLCTYLIPADTIAAPIRFAVGIFFVFLIPGNCLVNILFRKANRLDIIEQAVLSVALSFGIAGLVGLFLGLSPIGINFTSITVSLSSITLALAIAAYILKNRDLSHPETQKMAAQATDIAKTSV
jgi:uncharacterized membrane protein